jgi:molecular chaperone HscC
MIVGIDLGTTNSLAACMTPEGPRLIHNALGDTLTPSVVGIDRDGQVLVGRAARELRVTAPERCSSMFKRYMGDDWATELDGRRFSAVELSSLVLKSLRQDAEAFAGEPVTRAVITVPAYFNEHQRTATIKAGEIAGFKVERILNEPTAAAIAYGVQDAGEDRICLVFDLGGGTFDVSIVDVFDGTLEIRASSGETFLGGEDFTDTLTARILERVGEVFERAEIAKPLLVSRLRKECETAKRELTRSNSATVRIPDKNGEIAEECRTESITRAEFKEWTNSIIDRVDAPVRRALGDASLKRADIDEAVLVGGATRMPGVVERVGNLFGREPKCSINPDEVVAMGAAVQAALIAKDSSLEDLVVTDVSPFTLGVEIMKEFAGNLRDGYFSPIINRNTTIPVSQQHRFGTVEPNQTQLRVKVFQGESRTVKDNLLIGEFVVKEIPPGPAGQEVDIRFTYDLNGVLEIEATVVETQRKVTHVVTRYAEGLSNREIGQAIRDMGSLKTHPREESENRFLLRWGERLFRELPLTNRNRLESMLSGFEEALDQQDEALIERHREALRLFLSALDPDSDSGDGDSDA